MPNKPYLNFNLDTLTIKTQNSFKNSALHIYKINISVKQAEKIILISADQAVGKSNKEIFKIGLCD
jgi:hypothetical protein